MVQTLVAKEDSVAKGDLVTDGRPDTAIAESDRQELEQCEAIIARGLRAFREVGTALATIREKRLYRETHATFAEYVEQRWEMSLNYAERQMTASMVVGHLEESANWQTLPATESQARPLTTLRTTDENGKKVIDLEQVAEVWTQIEKDASESDASITAANVKRAVDQHKPRRLSVICCPDDRWFQEAVTQ